MNPDLNKETEDSIYFFTPAYYALDNFSAFTVSIWDETFQTSEHAYQWKKFQNSNPEIAQQILKAKSPSEVKQISDSHKDSVDVNFRKNKLEIMNEILRAKYDQHEIVRDLLQKTGDKLIIENSPMDDFWGIGHEGTGQNMLGKLWMKIRFDSK